MNPLPSSPAQPPEATPASSGCFGFFIALAFWSGLWLGVCFLFFWWLGTEAAAVAFFGPPLGLALWAIFTKHKSDDGGPKSGGGLDQKP